MQREHGVARTGSGHDVGGRPRAVSIDVDLSSPAVPANSHVLLVALVGSGADDLMPAPPAPANVADLVQNWPQVAMQVIQVRARV